MATFQYIDNQGKTRTIEADDANLALQNATDIARTSGVQLVNQTPQINLGQIQDTTPFQMPQPQQAPVVPTPNFLTTSQIEQTPENELRERRTALETEIQSLEQQMANRTTNRNTALDDAGVFEDMRSLTNLRDELRRTQDEEIAIPIRARQDLRGTGATIREFQQRTTPQLEDNLLEQLTSSRRVSSLTDIINTNINIIDTQLQAQNEREDFIYSQKQKQLQTIETVYGNILTEKQKLALEEKKFMNEIAMESFKFENDLKKDAIQSLPKNLFADPNFSMDVSNMSLQDLYGLTASYSGTKVYRDMTLDEAMNLPPEDFKKYEAYQKLSSEQKTALDAETAVANQSLDMATLIQNLLNDEQGLKTSVGFGLGRTDFSILGAGVESDKFRAGAVQLMKLLGNQALADLRNTGVSPGPITEREWTRFDEIGSLLSNWSVGESGKFKVSEDKFKAELKNLEGSSLRLYLLKNLGESAYVTNGLDNDDISLETLRDLANDIKSNQEQSILFQQRQNLLPTSQQINPAQSSFIKSEEGFRSNAYQDPAGVWTIGYGSTQINGRPVQPNDRITQEQGEQLFQQDLARHSNFTNAINRPLTPSQQTALASFEYNLGPNIWNGDGREIATAINNGDFQTASRLMLDFNNVWNPILKEYEPNLVLTKRRQREAQLLLA